MLGGVSSVRRNVAHSWNDTIGQQCFPYYLGLSSWLPVLDFTPAALLTIIFPLIICARSITAPRRT